MSVTLTSPTHDPKALRWDHKQKRMCRYSTRRWAVLVALPVLICAVCIVIIYSVSTGEIIEIHALDSVTSLAVANNSYTEPRANESCLRKITPVLIEHCNSNNVCIISRDEPTWVESKYNLCTQFPWENEALRNVTAIDCPSPAGDEGFSAFFPCKHTADLGFTGVIYDFFKHRTLQTSDTMCVYTSVCTFNEVAEIVADFSSDENPKGIGEDAALVYAGFLLDSIHRRIHLKLSSSPPFATTKVVLMGMNGQDHGWRPLHEISKVVSWEVWWLLGLFFTVWVVIAFLFGVDLEMLAGEPEPADHWTGVWGLAWRRFWSIRFIPNPAREDQGTFDRLVVYRSFTRLMLLALAGTLLLFEGVLLIARPPENNLGEPLDNTIKQNKVHLVRDTALADDMVLYFHELSNHFVWCDSFRECDDFVSTNKGMYFISLEKLVFSKNRRGTVVPFYNTGGSLDSFAGVFFYSSLVPRDFQLDLNDRILRAKMDMYFEAREKIHGVRPSQGQSDQPPFDWQVLLIGMGAPVAIVAVMAGGLLALCMAFELTRFLRAQWQKGVKRLERAESTNGHYSDDGSQDGSANTEPSSKTLRNA